MIRMVAAALLILLTLISTLAAQSPVELDRALAWLATQQASDGGFSNGFAPESDISATADAVIAIVSAGQDPADWLVEGLTPMHFLRDQVARGALAGPGQAAKVALAVEAAGLDAAAFAGSDLTEEIRQGLDPETGFIGSGTFDTALGILALRAAGAPIPGPALAALESTRLADGSYAFSGETGPGAGDSNTTALAVRALAAVGRAETLDSSLNYFRTVQTDNGGWTFQKPSEFGEATDANSTSLVILTLADLGEPFDEWGDPHLALTSLQLASGAFAFQLDMPADNILATIQAIPALAVLEHSTSAATVSGANDPATLVLVTLVILIAVLIPLAWLGPRRGEES